MNDPYRVIFVFLLLLVARLAYGFYGLPMTWPEFKHLLLGEWLASGFSMYKETFDYTAPLSAWTYKGIDFLIGRSRIVHWIISGFLVLFQAVYFNRMLLKNKVLSEPIYVPAFLYAVCSISVFDSFALSPQLLSLTLVIISMDSLIQRMDNVARDELFLYPGFYLGMAGMFYLPSSVFFLVFLLAMFLIVQAKPRRILLYVFGWLTANGIILLILYINGTLESFWQAYFVELFREKIYYVPLQEMGLWMLIPGVLFILSLFASIGSREGKLHVKTQQFMLLILLASVGVMAIGGTLSGIDLIFFIPVFSFFLTNYFIKIKRRFWRKVIPGIMILGSLVAPFLALNFGLLGDDLFVKEADTPVANQKVMVIGPLNELHMNNQMAGPFFDERVSKVRRADLDYYESSLVWLDIFKKSSPELIVDEWELMDKVEYRFPEVEKMEIPRLSN